MLFQLSYWLLSCLNREAWFVENLVKLKLWKVPNSAVVTVRPEQKAAVMCVWTWWWVCKNSCRFLAWGFGTWKVNNRELSTLAVLNVEPADVPDKQQDQITELQSADYLKVTDSNRKRQTVWNSARHPTPPFPYTSICTPLKRCQHLLCILNTYTYIT